MSDFKIQSIKIDDTNYPQPILDLPDPPKILYYIGELASIDWENSLAVVGSRRMTTYGRQVIDKFVPDLVAKGVTIVSGFMYGVDTQAHKSTLDYGGKTVAVVACGVDVCYPIENKELLYRIIDSGGVIISEYPPGQKPHLWAFPRRNRIVAALSLLGTLVIEAGENSGSLVTAKLARKLKRPVYAIPGPITSSVSAGTNILLEKRLAKFTVNTGNIVSIEQNNAHEDPSVNLDGLEAKIYQTLLEENCTLDELSLIISEDISAVSTVVSLMTLKGLIEEFGGKLIAKDVR